MHNLYEFVTRFLMLSKKILFSYENYVLLKVKNPRGKMLQVEPHSNHDEVQEEIPYMNLHT